MTRIRPTMDHYHAAWDLLWYEAHADRLEHLGDGTWTVFLTDDVYDHRVHPHEKGLREAIRVARKLLEEPRKTAGE